jgi:hypothetical protein
LGQEHFDTEVPLTGLQSQLVVAAVLYWQMGAPGINALILVDKQHLH